MIGDAPLGKIIGSNALRTIAAANLAFALSGASFVDPAALQRAAKRLGEAPTAGLVRRPLRGGLPGMRLRRFRPLAAWAGGNANSVCRSGGLFEIEPRPGQARRARDGRGVAG